MFTRPQLLGVICIFSCFARTHRYTTIINGWTFTFYFCHYLHCVHCSYCLSLIFYIMLVVQKGVFISCTAPLVYLVPEWTLQFRGEKSSTQLGMEVYDHGQLAIDDPFGEILLILDIEGDLAAGGDGQGPWQRTSGWQKGMRAWRGAYWSWVEGCGWWGTGAAHDIPHRHGPNPPDEQPVSHLQRSTIKSQEQ